MHVTLAFYKGKGNLIDKIIRFWTKSKYSHVEIIINDVWVSSNPKVGVTVNSLRPLTNKWDYIDVKVPKNEKYLQTVLKFIELQKGKKYDLIGAIFGAGLNIDFEHKDKWFCSELVAAILLLFREKYILQHLKEDIFNVSPKELYDIYKDVYETYSIENNEKIIIRITKNINK